MRAHLMTPRQEYFHIASTFISVLTAHKAIFNVFSVQFGPHFYFFFSPPLHWPELVVHSLLYRWIKTAWRPLTKLHQCIDEAQEGDHEVEHKHSLQLQLHPRCHGTLTSWEDNLLWQYVTENITGHKVILTWDYLIFFCCFISSFSLGYGNCNWGPKDIHMCCKIVPKFSFSTGTQHLAC